MEVHWLETGSDSTDSPMLRAVFPVSIDNPKFYSQVPFYVAERPVDGKLNGKDAPSYLKHSDAYEFMQRPRMGRKSLHRNGSMLQTGKLV